MRYRFIDILRGTRTLRRYWQLVHTAYSPESLKSLQDQRLSQLLLFLQSANPYYQELLAGVDPAQIRANPRSIVGALPVSDKALMSRNRKRLFHPAPGRRNQAKQTGGSTGEPLRYHIDLEAVSQHWAYIFRCWHWYAGYEPGDSYVTIAGSSLGSFGGRFKTGLYRLLQNNYLIQGDLISSHAAVSVGRIKKALLLYGYPSSISSLLETRPDIFRSHRLRAVFTTSEQLLPAVRQGIEAKLGVPVYDMYGANDGGANSCECPEHAGFHYDPLNCYMEEYHNEEGLVELLLTSLNSFSFPFVRYRVGDVAELDDFGSCTCGDPFPMIRHLSGRVRDMVRFEDGHRVHGSKLNKFIFAYPEVRRYRVIQSEDYSIRFQVEIDDFDAWTGSGRRRRFEQRIGDILPGVGITIEPMVYGADGNRKFKVIESHVH